MISVPHVEKKTSGWLTLTTLLALIGSAALKAFDGR
jgi:hypothetical protein